MATRGAIARLTGIHPIRFCGVYYHWDSYPEGLGKTLWELYHTVFGKDLEALLKAVVDDHPTGWSRLHASDFDVADDGMQERKDGTGVSPETPETLAGDEKPQPALHHTSRKTSRYSLKSNTGILRAAHKAKIPTTR